MQPESTSPEAHTSLEKKRKEIYQQGFTAGTNGKRPEDNPYKVNPGESEKSNFPLSYFVAWEQGRIDGQDVMPKLSNLSPKMMEEKRQKFKAHLKIAGKE